MISIVFGRNSSDDKSLKLRKELKLVFSKIKEELDDHLESINQNTLEIQSNFEYVSRLSSRIDKLSQKIESIEMMLKQNIALPKEEVSTVLITREEEEVLALLLDSSAKNSLVDYQQIANKLNISNLYSASLVSSLISKGIRIEKKHNAGMVLLELDRDFFENNMKYSILTLD